MTVIRPCIRSPRECRLQGSSTQTLGGLLYAHGAETATPEADWVGLIDAIAAGDLHALLELCERTRGIVFAYLKEVTASGEDVKALTLDVFADVWRRASTYDAARRTVIAWIMEQARSIAIERQRLEPSVGKSLAADAYSPREIGESNELEPIAKWLAGRVRFDADREAAGATLSRSAEPQWKEVTPGISCKLLSRDTLRERVSMLVRLAAGVPYPPHRHAGLEELYLLEGELTVDEKKLLAGDYIWAEAGSADARVWSETGCMCVLVTSTQDELR